MNTGRDAADEFGAHLSQYWHRCDHKGIQAHVTNHVLSVLLCIWIIHSETRKLSVLGDQYQLRVGKKEKTFKFTKLQREMQRNGLESG